MISPGPPHVQDKLGLRLCPHHLGRNNSAEVQVQSLLCKCTPGFGTEPVGPPSVAFSAALEMRSLYICAKEKRSRLQGHLLKSDMYLSALPINQEHSTCCGLLAVYKELSVRRSPGLRVLYPCEHLDGHPNTTDFSQHLDHLGLLGCPGIAVVCMC